MPRKSLAEERIKQILDAFETCIVKYGLEGSSLEKIGGEAGVKRTILRHYIGNRDDLVHALCARVVKRWDEQLQHLNGMEFSTDNPKKFVNFLFQSSHEDSESILVAENLIASAEKYTTISTAMKKYIADYTKVLSDHLQNICPQADMLSCNQAAYGIIAIIFNEASLVTLKLPQRFQQAAKSSALRLVESLG